MLISKIKDHLPHNALDAFITYVFPPLAARFF